MISVIKSGPCKDLLNCDSPCPWYHLFFDISDFAQILTLFWSYVLFYLNDLGLMFLTLNRTPIPIIMSWDYSHYQSALQHFLFHRDPFLWNVKRTSPSITDWIEQHRWYEYEDIPHTEQAWMCFSNTQCRNERGPPQVMRRQWLKWDDPVPQESVLYSLSFRCAHWIAAESGYIKSC